MTTKSFNTKFNIGFTLSEVLVTLAVLGVIASLTVPALISSYEESQSRSSAKTAYLLLSNALLHMSDQNKLPDFSASGTDEGFRSAVCSQLNCLETAGFNEIFASFYNYYENKSAGNTTGAMSTPSAAISNGMLMRFVNYKTDCTTTRGSLTTICSMIEIDTNGEEVPNMWGKDFVAFRIIKEDGSYKVVPAGVKNDGNTCESSATGWSDSLGCTSYYILDKELP